MKKLLSISRRQGVPVCRLDFTMNFIVGRRTA
jgi:hypothetical protein